MRIFLDAILTFIGASALTDFEFTSQTFTDQTDHQQIYDGLKAIVVARESVSNTKERLAAYFLSKHGLNFEAPAGSSNIFVGASLCE